MTHPTYELERLRVENRELREELEEWRRRADDWRKAHENARWRQVFNARSQALSLVRLLVSTPGRYVTPVAMREAITENDTTEKHIHVVIHYARKALETVGIKNAIINSWGHGYMITPEGARQVRALVEG